MLKNMRPLGNVGSLVGGLSSSASSVAQWAHISEGLQCCHGSRFSSSSNLVQALVYPVVLYGCESWTIKKAERQRINAFELWFWRSPESPLDCTEIQPVHPKGNQSWIVTERTDADTETPIFWPPDAKSWLIWKDPDAGKYWGQKEKGTTEDEMVGWHHQLNGHEFEWTVGVGDGQGGLVCCSPWGWKASDTTEWLNQIELNLVHFYTLISS